MISPEAQAIAAAGGEVVSRASAYSADHFNSPAAADQKQWAALIHSRGREVQYTPILTTFHQIVGDAFQRMISPMGRRRRPMTKLSRPTTRLSQSRARAVGGTLGC